MTSFQARSPPLFEESNSLFEEALRLCSQPGAGRARRETPTLLGAWLGLIRRGCLLCKPRRNQSYPTSSWVGVQAPAPTARA